jgi:hypothetical protein
VRCESSVASSKPRLSRAPANLGRAAAGALLSRCLLPKPSRTGLQHCQAGHINRQEKRAHAAASTRAVLVQRTIPASLMVINETGDSSAAIWQPWFTASYRSAVDRDRGRGSHENLPRALGSCRLDVCGCHALGNREQMIRMRSMSLAGVAAARASRSRQHRAMVRILLRCGTHEVIRLVGSTFEAHRRVEDPRGNAGRRVRSISSTSGPLP